MNLITLLFLAVGLSMDAFAVSVCKGLAMPGTSIKKCGIVGIWFGSFQGLMPLIGYLLGVQFAAYIDSFSSWIAFILLSFIGVNMIREAIQENDCENPENGSLRIKEMFLLAIATSIDALAVGITFACVPVHLTGYLTPLVNTILGCLIIAVTTCFLSIIGVKIGNTFGSRFRKKAEIAGGIILILLGIKIIAEYFI